jgi:hypothetical protein
MFSSPFKGEVRRGMGLLQSRNNKTHPHPDPPLEGEGFVMLPPLEGEGTLKLTTVRRAEKRSAFRRMHNLKSTPIRRITLRLSALR